MRICIGQNKQSNMSSNVLIVIYDRQWAYTRRHAIAGATARCALYNNCTNPLPQAYH